MNKPNMEEEIDKRFEKKNKKRKKKMKVSGAGVKKLQKIIRDNS